MTSKLSTDIHELSSGLDILISWAGGPIAIGNDDPASCHTLHVEGSYESSCIYSSAKELQEKFEACGRKQLKIDSSVKGKLTISFTIIKTGKVTRFSVSPSKFEKTYFSDCIAEIFKQLNFPKFDGPPKKISFPYTIREYSEKSKNFPNNQTQNDLFNLIDEKAFQKEIKKTSAKGSKTIK
jgi:hypothetical protein